MKWVQIVHNDKQLKKQQQLGKKYRDFSKLVLRFGFIELKNSCFVYDFIEATLLDL